MPQKHSETQLYTEVLGTRIGACWVSLDSFTTIGTRTSEGLFLKRCPGFTEGEIRNLASRFPRDYSGSDGPVIIRSTCGNTQAKHLDFPIASTTDAVLLPSVFPLKHWNPVRSGYGVTHPGRVPFRKASALHPKK